MVSTTNWARIIAGVCTLSNLLLDCRVVLQSQAFCLGRSWGELWLGGRWSRQAQAGGYLITPSGFFITGVGAVCCQQCSVDIVRRWLPERLSTKDPQVSRCKSLWMLPGPALYHPAGHSEQLPWEASVLSLPSSRALCKWIKFWIE